MVICKIDLQLTLDSLPTGFTATPSFRELLEMAAGIIVARFIFS
jgi:hypothetical protein